MRNEMRYREIPRLSVIFDLSLFPSLKERAQVELAKWTEEEEKIKGMWDEYIDGHSKQVAYHYKNREYAWKWGDTKSVSD